MNKSFRIKFNREKLNLSQKEIALKLGITQSAYSKMEYNEARISLDKIKLIAKAIGVTLDEIIYDDDSLHKNKKLADYTFIRWERDRLN